jgi:hypothetical protein
MKNSRRIALASILLFASCFSFAQSPEVRFSSLFEKSGSITSSQVLDPGFDDVIVFWMRRGTTSFKQEGYLISVDRKTLATVKKVPIIVHNDLKSYWGEYALAGNKSIYMPAYKIDKKADEITVYSYKMDENFEHSAMPKKCFTGPAPKGGPALEVTQNAAKDILVFSYVKKDRKAKIERLYYYVMNADLELINSNVIERHYKTESDKSFFHVYESGIVYNDPTDPSKLHVVDFKDNSEFTVSNDVGFSLMCQKITITKDNKLLIAGAYSDGNETAYRLEIAGFFTGVIDPTTKTISNFQSTKFIEPIDGTISDLSDVLVTESGNTYFVSSMLKKENDGPARKMFQLYYISASGEMWNKDLPIPSQQLGPIAHAQSLDCKVILNGENFSIVYVDNQDASVVSLANFKNSSKKTLGGVSLVKPSRASISILTVSPTGEMTRKSVKGPNSEFINGTYTVNGNILYSPVRYVKGMTYGKSSIMMVTF